MNKRQKLSAAIIAFNEEQNIARCIRSLHKVSDDIIVVDSGSTDKTVQIANDAGARVFTRAFDNYINQKNYAADQSSYDYVISLDADEVLSEELAKSVIEALNLGLNQSGYKMSCRNWYCGQWIYHGGWYPNRKVRMWNRREGRWGGPTPHEIVEFAAGGAQLQVLEGDILHYSYESVEEHLEKSRMYARLASTGLQSRPKTYLIAKMVFSPPFKFIKNLFLRRGYADGWRGYHIARIALIETYWKYAWALSGQRNSNR